MDKNVLDRLARWHNTLNHWEWPNDLPGKPDGWDSFPDISRNEDDYTPNKYDWSHGIMKEIQEIIGYKETLRWHHIHNMNKTNDEFEAWWNENSHPNK